VAEKQQEYEVLNGLDYPSTKTQEDVRREPGDVVSDIPPKSIAWLLEQGHIRKKEAK